MVKFLACLFIRVAHSCQTEPVYRVAEKEWKDFIESFTDVLIEVDDEIPTLPPKDVIHRIYRDVRPITSVRSYESFHLIPVDSLQ